MRKASETQNPKIPSSIEDEQVKLRTQTRLFETWMNLSPDGCFLADNRGKLLEVNDGYCRMSGFPREELLHLYIMDFEADEKQTDIIRRIQTLTRAGFQRFETRHKRKDGSLIEVEVSAYWQAENDQVLIFVRDITDKKQAENRAAEEHAHMVEVTEDLSTSLEEVRTTEEELRTTTEILQQQNEELVTLQAELESFNLHYESLFQFAPFGYMVTDLQGIIRECNQAALTLLGSDMKDLLGKALVLYVARDEREKFRDCLERAKTGKDTDKQEQELLMRRGNQDSTFSADMAVAPIREPDGSLSGLRWLMTDITARKHAEKELEKYRLHLEEMVKERTAQLEAANAQLQEEVERRRKTEEDLHVSEEKYRNIVRLAPAAIYEIDFTGSKALSVNDTACQWLGYSREELMAIDPLSLTDDAGRESFRRRIERKLAGKPVDQTSEMKIKTKDRRQVVWELHVGTFTYQDGKPVSVLVVAHDITGRKRMDEEIRQSAEELRSANEELMRFNRAMVGRELRMIDLKREVNELCQTAGQPPRYPVEFDKSKR
jgi:PAS domain S-box-containing protein